MDSPHERLVYARELAGHKTAADAARAMKIHYPTYAGHENGARGFDKQAPRYAGFYKVSLTWLLTGRGEARPGPDNIQARFLSLTPQGRQTVRDMLEMLEERETSRRRKD